MDTRSRLYLQVQVISSLSVQEIDPQKGELGRLNVEVLFFLFLALVSYICGTHPPMANYKKVFVL